MSYPSLALGFGLGVVTMATFAMFAVSVGAFVAVRAIDAGKASVIESARKIAQAIHAKGIDVRIARDPE